MNLFPEDFVLQSNSNYKPYAGYCCALHRLHSVQIFINFADRWKTLLILISWLMPRSHIQGSPRWFHYRSNPTDDPGNDNFHSPIPMHNASTTTYDYGCNTEIYRLILIATDDAGSNPWLILRQIRECVTWALWEAS